ncbi:sulfite exporter TauE/SafE family protein [Streptomyces sp. ActVer]|uniref:sulfite exporter TauE/SafE family protein n=1 Tax=Streptomyces sp. ActVer TaxID=3014558 RepID=UPI0022B526D9|nr:sulfite exporter TauE/SafE family protein [Streptomyces sp. ActVer]MCZ4511845.1 sulfite exporter TauE/SafE family protein [Streptomyces sp. ActVer]
MRTLVLLALAGLGAQLVDGSLGMAYGVTSTTLLLSMGTNPAAASATVHLAEIGTTLMSGASHWRFGNVDWKVVAKIGVPGAVGAFIGATVLSGLSRSSPRPSRAPRALFGRGEWSPPWTIRRRTGWLGRRCRLPLQ